MKKYKLACLIIALCGIFSANPVHAEGGDGGFDGGFDGGDSGGDFGSDFDSGGYTDYMDQGGFDQSDAFYQQDEFNQPEDYGTFDDANQGNDFDQVDATHQPDDQVTSYTADGGTDTTPNDNGVGPESLKKELSGQSVDAVDDPSQGNQAVQQADTVGQQSGIDAGPDAGSNAVSADAAQPAGNDQLTQENAVVQDNASTQNVAVQNNTYIDQNNGYSDYSGHGHHHGGGHHHYDNFGLGFGLGLGVGLGFGFGPFGYYSPFAPFGYYGFGMPFNSFGFYSGRGVGIGFYNSYTGFGPYRYFEPYYPLGGYWATSPVFSSPMVLAPTRAPTYIQRNEVSGPAQAQQRNYWYYCRNPEGYYPYVKQCSGQWIKVPPQPS